MKTSIYMNGRATNLENIFEAVECVPWYRVSPKHTGRPMDDIISDWVKHKKTYYYLNGIKTTFELKLKGCNTMIIKTINFSQFVDAFYAMGRFEQFSYDGLESLFNYLENLSDDLGEHIELDVIALCCEYTEYKNIDKYNEQYDNECKSIEDIERYTSVINIDDERFIIAEY